MLIYQKIAICFRIFIKIRFTFEEWDEVFEEVAGLDGFWKRISNYFIFILRMFIEYSPGNNPNLVRLILDDYLLEERDLVYAHGDFWLFNICDHFILHQ